MTDAKTRRKAVTADATLEFTDPEGTRFVAKIRPIFEDTVGRFDTDKYPQDVYAESLAAFAKPTRVSPGAIRNALLWKFGHLKKRGRIPATHRKLIADRALALVLCRWDGQNCGDLDHRARRAARSD